MKRTMTSKKLLLGTVALMAGVGLASAQGMREGTSGTPGAGAEQHGTSSASPAAKSQGGAEIKSKGSSETRGRATGATEQKAQAPQRAQPDKNRISGQTKPERSTTGQGSSDKDELKASGKENLKTKSSGKEDLKARSSERENMKAKGRGSAKTNERSTTGQGTSEKTDSKGAADSKTQTPNVTGQGQTSGSATQNQNATQQQSGAAVRSQAGKQITAQQETSIQQSVLSARNAPRVDHVNFAVHTGAVVPRSVNVVAISTFPILIETFPQYRDYSFFVVEDEIVFVDRGHKIVDVVPAGPRARFSRSSGPTAVAVNLSEPEIREVQQVLVTRGFLHGRVTGVWGPETREALIAFQRKEGFTANGTIDTRTVSALGLSGKVKAQESSSTQGSSSTTTGQGQSGSNGQGRAGQNASSQNQPTTGQSPSGGHNQPSDKQSGAPSQSTTGQGGESSMNGGSSSSSTPGHSSSSPSTSGSSGQSNMPEKNKN
jgi:murein L,D-transpeptidase YcbB/YkuD